MATPVVLIVDDEALLRMLSADYCSEAGFEVLMASSGTQALKIMKNRSDIKAVVTDVQMPGEPNGFVLSHIVRHACPDCAIVVVSGRSAPELGNLAERARYMSKPYRGEDVVSSVEEMLAA